MTIHVFAGPTIPAARITELLPGARQHPPIQHGTIIGLDPRPGDVLAIVDGLFYLNAAVRHKEILRAIDRGVHVVGGSSMGALRAAELLGHGMVGVGRVYEMYRDGVIDGDDEVALSHATAEHGYRPLSLALVAVREAVRQAVAKDGLDERTGPRLIEQLRGQHFPERTLFLLRRIAGYLSIAEPVLDRLVRRLDGTEPDLKRRDAELVLRRAGELTGAASPAAPEFVKTHHVTRWEQRFTEVGGVPRGQALGLLQLCWPGFPALYESVVRARLAKSWGVPDDTAELAAEFASRTGIADVSPELARRWLYPESAGGADALLRLAVVSFRQAPGVAPLAAVEAALPTGLLERAARIRAGLPEEPAGDVRGWLADLWDLPADVDVLRRAGFARGFRDWGELDAVARRLGPVRDSADVVRELASPRA
jgi:hypothetical protein